METKILNPFLSFVGSVRQYGIVLRFAKGSTGQVKKLISHLTVKESKNVENIGFYNSF